MAHSGPFARGIHLTATLPLARKLDAGEARALYAERYRGLPYIGTIPRPAPRASQAAPDMRSE